MRRLPILTISIVTSNRLHQLQSCLNLLIPQINSKIKIQIIDNNQRPIFKKIKKNLPNLIFSYFHEKNIGIPFARNRAIKECTTPYLAFIDDDCLPSVDWVVSALRSIKKNPQATFIVGQNQLSNPQSPIAKLNYQKYSSWFLSNLHLDTKNVIFNLKKLGGIKFDTQFSIFEDVDLQLSLKQKNLTGLYDPLLKVFHPELSNFIQTLKKNYFRGHYKFKLEQKWGNIDDYQPLSLFQILKHPSKIFNKFTNYFFDLGYLDAKFHPKLKNLVTVVNTFDRGANQERAENVSRYLIKHQYNVLKFDSQVEFDKTVNRLSSIFKYPYHFLIYRFTRLLCYKLRLPLHDQLFYQKILFRGLISKNYLHQTKTSIAIIQCPEDMTALHHPRQYKTIYDSPTLYTEELSSLPQLKHIITKLKIAESLGYLQSNAVCFHWYTFANYSKLKSLNIPKLFTLNWCTTGKTKKTEFSKKPKIIYLGKLNSSWINPPLLSTIQENSPFPVNIFSYEKPENINIKYSGFMDNLDDIAQYQFGLLTFTNDELRNHGFSAKHLLYLSFGLPVLSPDWRHDELLKPATIYYNSKNFNQIVEKYSNQKLWNRKHLAALKLAKKLLPENQLKPLLKQIDTLLTSE